jgi:hypothetical protein
VTNGCRAEFELGTGYGATAGMFRCESTSNRTRYCNVDTRSGVQIVRQLSRDPCIEGRSWGMTREQRLGQPRLPGRVQHRRSLLRRARRLPPLL